MPFHNSLNSKGMFLLQPRLIVSTANGRCLFLSSYPSTSRVLTFFIPASLLIFTTHQTDDTDTKQTTYKQNKHQ